MKKYLIFTILMSAIIFMAYKGLIYYDDQFKYGRMRETPAVKPHEKKPLAMERGVIPFTGGEAYFRAANGEDLKSPLNKDIIHRKQGKILYFTYCAQCHGKYHDGNGTVGQSFYPLPSDLRTDKVQSTADGVIFKEVSYGKINGRQPPLAGTIDIPDRWKIIAYIKSLGIRKPNK